MLGMLINTNMPWANNTWKLWVDHIMKNKGAFGFKKASLVHSNGATASATPGFIIHPQDIQRIKEAFHKSKTSDTLNIQGKTFIIKSVEPDRIVAFNGSKYYIITRSKSMFIITLVDCRSKCDDAAMWLRKLNTRLVDRDY